MRLQRMCKRKADNLTESNRLKRRRLGDQGNNKLINVVIYFMEAARWIDQQVLGGIQNFVPGWYW